MNIIKQNPFRILGLTGNATEKELQKQIGIIKRYAEVGKTKSFDYDFEFIGDFTRTSDEIQQASNSIEQAHKKLLYSLFWFVNNNQFDEIAFNNLKENETDKAIEIWNKTLKEEITSKNYSSYLNLSTLYIALSTIDDQIELQKLQAGISLKGNLIHSENLKDFSKLVTGNGIVNDPIEISKKFVDEVIELLKPYLNKNRGISTNDLISLFSTFPTIIQKYISSKFTEIPISCIENKIEKTTRNRKDNPRNANELGEELYKSTKNDISALKKIMCGSNVQFQMVVNKLANEIMQCAIEYYNLHRKENKNIDPGDNALKIAEYSRTIGANGQTIDRINENTIPIQKWVDDKPNREKQEAISYEVGFITTQLVIFENQQDSASNVEDLISKCKPQLREIKNKLGKYDEFYINISSAVVQNAQNMLVTSVNSATEDFSRRQKLTASIFDISTISLEPLVKKVLELTFLLGYFDMNSVLKEHYNNNLQGIKSLASNLNISTISPKDRITSEIKNLESKLSSTKSKTYYANEIQALRNELSDIKQWKMLRSDEAKESQIREQQGKIDKLNTKSEAEKKQEISRLEEQVYGKRYELKELAE